GSTSQLPNREQGQLILLSVAGPIETSNPIPHRSLTGAQPRTVAAQQRVSHRRLSPVPARMKLMGTESASIRVRRGGFRRGTDEELAAMHLVESEIEAERRPGRPAQPLESYIAFARDLPSQFDDHTWLATASDDTPVGCSACWSDAAGDPRVMQSYVY